MDCGHPWPLRAESPAVLEYSWSLAGPPRLVRCPWSPWICAMFSWWLESTKAGCVIGDPFQFQDSTEPDLILMNSNDVCNSSIKIKGCRRPLCELQVMTELSHARSWFTWVSKSRRVWSQKKTVSISEASEVWSCNLIRTQLHHLDHVRLTSYNYCTTPHINFNRDEYITCIIFSDPGWAVDVVSAKGHYEALGPVITKMVPPQDWTAHG